MPLFLKQKNYSRHIFEEFKCFEPMMQTFSLLCPLKIFPFVLYLLKLILKKGNEFIITSLFIFLLTQNQIINIYEISIRLYIKQNHLC